MNWVWHFPKHWETSKSEAMSIVVCTSGKLCSSDSSGTARRNPNQIEQIWPMAPRLWFPMGSSISFGKSQTISVNLRSFLQVME